MNPGPCPECNEYTTTHKVVLRMEHPIYHVILHGKAVCCGVCGHIWRRNKQ